ncbi:MAG: peptidylprolyl isomerase [Paracoccaceae bacterium]
MRNLLAAGAIACFSLTAVQAQESEVSAETVLAVVNGTEITMGHVILLRTQLPDQYLSAPDDLLFEGILDQLIDQTLLGGTMTKDSLKIRLTLENETRALRAATVIDAIIGAPFSDEEIQAAYDVLYDNFSEQPEFNASHILVETEDEAKALIVALEAGADFAELAKEKSTGPSGPDGGELGWFGIGMMVPPFEAAVLGMEEGQISAPVQTQFGWHVLILNSKRNKPVPELAMVLADLTLSLQQEKLDATVTELRNAASVEIMVEGVDSATIKNLDLLSD